MVKRTGILLLLLTCYLTIKLLVPDDLERSPGLTESEFNADYQMEQVKSTHYNASGHKSYGLTATKINFSNQQQRSEFTAPEINVSTDEALISLEAPIAYSEHLNTLVFPQQVVINSQQLDQSGITEIKTSALTANFDSKTIDTDAAIEVNTVAINSRSTLSGTGLSMDLVENRIQIKQDLRSQLEIKSQENDNK